jgi:hypothetical protein
LVAANATALSTHFLLEASPSYPGDSRARFPSLPVPFDRGERYLIVGLIQTMAQIEFSVSTAELGSFRLEVMFRHEEVVEAERSARMPWRT